MGVTKDTKQIFTAAFRQVDISLRQMTLTNIVSAMHSVMREKQGVSVVCAASEYLMGSLLGRNVSTLASYGHALKAVTVLPGSALIPAAALSRI